MADTAFALSIGDREADINMLGAAAAEALARAIVRAVKFGEDAGGRAGAGVGSQVPLHPLPKPRVDPRNRDQ